MFRYKYCVHFFLISYRLFPTPPSRIFSIFLASREQEGNNQGKETIRSYNFGQWGRCFCGRDQGGRAWEERPYDSGRDDRRDLRQCWVRAEQENARRRRSDKKYV